MVKRINIVEAAAALAEKVVKSYYEDICVGLSASEVNSLIYQRVGEDIVYTDTAQEIFSTVYDDVFETLENCEHVED